MAKLSDDVLKRPLYVFDLPQELISSLQSRRQPQDDQIPTEVVHTTSSHEADHEARGTALSCSTCRANFDNRDEQRQHMHSDWHSYNLRQKINGLKVVTEPEFGRLLGDLDLSLSGSEESSSEDEDSSNRTRDVALANLLRKQTQLSENTASGQNTATSKKTPGSAPLLWLSSSLLPPHISLGVYKALFSQEELDTLPVVDIIRLRQLKPPAEKGNSSDDKTGGGLQNTPNPMVFLCMIGGGHFAGMIVSLTPKFTKNAAGQEERQAVVIVHKTFHRYTTRRKQGGSQSVNDSSKGNAHSAGAGIRRHNEVALQSEVRHLLAEWSPLIRDCKLLFVRATGNTNRRTLFGPYDDQILRPQDPRVRSFPFSTRRATQSELMRAFVELTRAKVSENAAVPPRVADQVPKKETMSPSPHTQSAKPAKPKPSREEEEAGLHTSQLQSLIRRSKAPAVISYLTSHSLSPNFTFYPTTNQANYHSPTPLHLASSTNSTSVVLSLLTKAKADPTIPNGDGKVALDITGERATRDAFRVARFELGEEAWDWHKAHCPPPLTRDEANKREADERAEAQKTEELRRNTEMARLAQERSGLEGKSNEDTGRRLKAQETSAEDRREVEGRGLTPEMKMKLERERRARAAEERMKRMNGK